MRIIQLLPTISYGDAVGNDALAIQDILWRMGFKTRIYAENIDPRLPKGTAESFAQFPELQDDDVIIYHGSTGTDLNFRFPELGGRKVMIYHNVTPPEFFHPYSSGAESLTAYGLQGMRHLADKLDYCIADSEFNKKDLLRMGYTCPIDVCPILIPFSDYEKEPSREIMRTYGDGGYVNWLFVGRIAPNKKQEDIIRAFYFYHKFFDPRSRLILAGSWDGMERYYDRLCDYTERLGLTQHVFFTGHVKFDEILAYYQIADVFVCMSEHEGFCVPLLEAMHFDVPIVAYAGAAVPGTLGGSGVLLDSKAPDRIAATVHEILNDDSLKEAILEKQRERLRLYQHKPVSQILEGLLRNFISTVPQERRQTQIVQLTTTIGPGDAVSNDIVAFQNAIVEMGYPSPIYAEHPPGKGWRAVRDLSQLPVLREDDIAIYHHATGTELSRRFSELPCKKVLVYHNVTPPAFFAPFDINAAKSCQWGLDNLAVMREHVDLCVADSKYNKKDLEKMGFTCPIHVCPILIPFEDYAQNADQNVLNRFRDGRTNLIFVGRVAPNKRIEDVISAFAEYKKLDPASRLILVGSYDPKGSYYEFLWRHVENLQIEDVLFTGHIRFSEILAYYRAASVFVCMSEHEGFCVPLVEAMYFDVPIVAYASTAIPGTLGGSGVLMETKEPKAVADAIFKLTQDSSYRERVLQVQRERVKAFSYESTQHKLKSLIRSFLE